jgi:hypothetical protein
MTGRTGSRAPRATATRPAITPAQPSTMANHSETVTNVAVRCSECHHGGPLVRCSDGTETFGPAAEIPAMMTMDAVMAAAASHAVRRTSSGRCATSGEPEGSAGGALVPSTPFFSLTESPVRWS